MWCFYVDTCWSRLGGLCPLAVGRGRVCATTLCAGVLPPIELGLLYYGPLHQVSEVPIDRLSLGLIRLGDRSEHHGRHNHVLPRVEEILHAIAAFSDLIKNLPRMGPFGFNVSLNVVVNLVEPLDE